MMGFVVRGMSKTIHREQKDTWEKHFIVYGLDVTWYDESKLRVDWLFINPVRHATEIITIFCSAL